MKRSLTTTLIAATVIAVAIAGCSSNTTSSNTDGAAVTPTIDGTSASPPPEASASAASSDSAVPYTGPDAQFLDTKLPDPTVKPGVKFILGFLNAADAFPSLLAEVEAACAEAERLGGSCVAYDAASDPQKQVSQFNSLLAQNVSAIVVQPVNPDALAPSLAEAAAQGIPVIAADTPSATSDPALPNLLAQVSQLSDYASYETATAVAQRMPGAHFAMLGISAPIPILKYISDQTKYWAEQQGLIFDGQVDAAAPTPAGYSAAANTIGQKYPDATVVFAFNDAAALAAANTLRASGRDDIVVADANGFTGLAKTAIQDGSMIASFAQDWPEKGRNLAIAAYNAVTGGTVPPVIGVNGVVVTADNVDSVTPIG